MKKVITITLNPSLDETLITRHLKMGYTNHVAATKHLDASGRGVNISRALDCLNSPTEAIIVLGDDTVGLAYRSLIRQESFANHIIRYEGHTRSDTIIVDEGEHKETHIIDEDSIGPRKDITDIVELIDQRTNEGDIVVCAGTLPQETPNDIYLKLVDVAHDAGAQVALVANDEPLKLGLKSVPEIVVVMQREIESLFNFPVRTLDDICSSAHRIQELGCRQVLVVMNDYSGIALIDQNHTWFAEMRDFETNGTDSGVVDAMSAAFLSAWIQGRTAEESLELGAAGLTYAAGKVGNEFGSTKMLDALMRCVSIQRIDKAA